MSRQCSRDYAGIWRAAEKIVYSRTLQTPSSARTRIEREFEPDAIRQLKLSSTADIAVAGGELAGQAIGAGLVDECHLFLCPIVVGGGKRALPDNVRAQLELLDERRFRKRRRSSPLPRPRPLTRGKRGFSVRRRSGAVREAPSPASSLNAVAEVDDAAAESVLVDELEVGARVDRQCGVAPTEDDWPDEQGQPRHHRSCIAVETLEIFAIQPSVRRQSWRPNAYCPMRPTCEPWCDPLVDSGHEEGSTLAP